MNKKDVAISLLIVVGIVIICCVLMERSKGIEDENSTLKKKLREVEADRILVIQDNVKRNPEISDVIENQLLDLIKRFSSVSAKVAYEIHQSLELFQLGRKEDAIASLAKIMENLLKYHYSNHSGFKEWFTKKSTSFHDYLDYCHLQDKKISKVEFQFYHAVKTIRNAEAHELDINLEDNINSSGLLSAISGITKLSSLGYPQ